MNRNISLKYGVLAGGVVILYLLLFYLIEKGLMFSMGVAWSSILIYAFFMYKAIAEQRTIFEGKITFREAVSVAFLTFIIANIIYYVFHYPMVKLDPSLVGILKEMSIDFYKKIMSNQDGEEIEKSFKDFDINLSTIFLSFARGAIGGFILSLPLAGFMRR